MSNKYVCFKLEDFWTKIKYHNELTLIKNK
jgi:hypothetical protein